MEGCKAAGVKRIVITSSLAAVQVVAPADKPKDNVWRESHWSDVNREGGMHPYLESKTLAERAAWNYLTDLPPE